MGVKARAALAIAVAIGLGAAAAAEPPPREVVVGRHARETLPRDVQRLAVGDPAVLEVEAISSRELLVLGRRPGRTTVLLWYPDGTVDERVYAVERDLSLLRSALAEIHPGVRVESAPDRDAVVLRGVVPDVRFSRAAEAAARGYLGGSSFAEQPLVRGPLETGGEGDAPGLEGGEALGSGERIGAQAATGPDRTGGARGEVINLIRVGALPATLEQRLRTTLDGLGGERVQVRRIVNGDAPDDAADGFVLEGPVPNQIDLVRMLIAASRVLGAADSGIEVLANEAGALGSLGPSSGGGGGGTRIGAVGSAGVGFGSRGGGSTGNDLGANIARATALAAGGGRILAFLDVEDLPQVRVEARIYEVNRSRLRSWQPQIDIIGSDFDQSAVRPSVAGQRIQGDLAPRPGTFGSVDVQGALSLIRGAALGQWQLVASSFAIDALFSILQDNSLARSLAQPSIAVLSGETAEFQAGGQIPINVAIETDTSAATGSALFSSVVFADFGVNLRVRPLVGADDVITLDVVPDISTPDLQLTAALRETTGSDQAATSFETRSLRTSARLRDGEALLIGGLLSRSQSVRSTETPGLARIPGLGWLARDFDRQGDDLEVVVVVTPAITRDLVPGAALWAHPGSGELLRRAGNSAPLAGTQP
jgi:pilus assembly protein CpaC